MMTDQQYVNGQKKAELMGNQMTHFFNDGTIKAKGPYEDDKMQGEWKFYRKTGQLWQVGHFIDDMKNGSWIRYDKEGHLDYSETFKENEIIKN